MASFGTKNKGTTILIFLRGYLKQRVYNPMPKAIDELKQNIERKIKQINKKTLLKTFENF